MEKIMNPSEKKKGIIAVSIFFAHVRKIGIIRTITGAGLMYLSVVEFIFVHLSFIILFYNRMMRPFNVPVLKSRNYIIMDRGSIRNMTWFDKLNCQFCGYANGTAKLWNDQLDNISRIDFYRYRSLLYKPAIVLYSSILLVFLIFNFIFSKFLYLIIALILGYSRVSTVKVWRMLKEMKYGEKLSPVFRRIIQLSKVYAYTLICNLEQIESAWCPLKHLNSKDYVFTPHHKNFYERDKLKELVEYLEQYGSVSDRKPEY
jgi:hypothetical protein